MRRMVYQWLDHEFVALSADFTANTLLGIVPLVVTFTDRSAGNRVSWDWNFGDGSQHSSGQNPTHIYIGDAAVTVGSSRLKSP